MEGGTERADRSSAHGSAWVVDTDQSHRPKAVSVVNILAHVTKPGGDGSPGRMSHLLSLRTPVFAVPPCAPGRARSRDRERGPPVLLRLCR